MTAACALYGVLVLLSSLQAWRTARSGDIDAHKRWALRAFALGIASFLYRFWFLAGAGLGLLVPARGSAFYSTAFMQFDEWWFFLPNLVIVEWLVRAKVGKSQRLILDLFVAGLALVLGGLPIALSVAGRHHHGSSE
eukprot:TRINITY_DN60451_c0_g1_i1.p1 TRINITY_DN60451_c0_g1~~TRINITY_DN60451_c0_g1_i1.p1  ORF type:complete len:137 (+),score=30.92 TRINITY_DN60451_c0_g1_i1:232-642(+)